MPAASWGSTLLRLSSILILNLVQPRLLLDLPAMEPMVGRGEQAGLERWGAQEV